MDIIESFLATEVLASIVMVGAVAMVVRSYISYAKDAGELGPKLEKIEKELDKIRKRSAPMKKLVTSLNKLVNPLKERADRYTAYYEELREVELEGERDAVANKDEVEAENRRRVQRKRMGLTGGEEEEEEEE